MLKKSGFTLIEMLGVIIILSILSLITVPVIGGLLNQGRENLSKIQGITQEEIEKLTKEIQDAQIYAQAPEALGGISEKIQYYCYINEDRGHLYNWLLNPENKFNK